MKGDKILKFITSLCLVLSINCGSGAPDNWIPQPKDVPREQRGAWVTVDYTSADNSKTNMKGEFVACNKDTVYILTEQEFLTIPVSSIQSLRVFFYESHPWAVIGLTVLGTGVSIPLNGLLTVISGPIWLVGGIIATITEASRPVYSYPSYTLDELSKYSRFPQGMRPDSDRSGFIKLSR